MKKLLIVFGILLLLCAIGAAVFIATFDLDRYRPQVLRQLETVLGRPVKIDRLSLAWRGGIAVDAAGLEVGEKAPRSGPMVRAEKISAVLQPVPLLHKRVIVSSLDIVRPVVTVEKMPDGSLNMQQLASPARTEGAGGNAAASPQPEPKTAALAPNQPAPASAAQFAVQRIRILEGTLRYSDSTAQPPFQLTMEQVRVDAALRRNGVDLKSFSAVLVPDGSSQVPSVRGKLSASFNGSLEPPAGKGDVKLEDGAVVNLNILREVFQKMSILPGLVERLLANLPASYQQKFQSPDTAVKSAASAFFIAGGGFTFKDFRIETDTFELTGSAGLQTDGTVNGSAVLRIDQELSAAMVQGVSELQYLADTKDRLQFPVLFGGKSPRIVVAPDVNYLTRHVIGNKLPDSG